MRILTQDENPTDVLNKIDDFISNRENPDEMMLRIGNIMKETDSLEMVIQGLRDKAYREEMLGYITMMRNYTTSVLDALDSMLEI